MPSDWMPRTWLIGCEERDHGKEMEPDGQIEKGKNWFCRITFGEIKVRSLELALVAGSSSDDKQKNTDSTEWYSHSLLYEEDSQFKLRLSMVNGNEINSISAYQSLLYAVIHKNCPKWNQSCCSFAPKYKRAPIYSGDANDFLCQGISQFGPTSFLSQLCQRRLRTGAAIRAHESVFRHRQLISATGKLISEMTTCIGA